MTWNLSFDWSSVALAWLMKMPFSSAKGTGAWEASHPGHLPAKASLMNTRISSKLLMGWSSSEDKIPIEHIWQQFCTTRSQSVSNILQHALNTCKHAHTLITCETTSCSSLSPNHAATRGLIFLQIWSLHSIHSGFSKAALRLAQSTLIPSWNIWFCLLCPPKTGYNMVNTCSNMFAARVWKAFNTAWVTLLFSFLPCSCHSSRRFCSGQEE